jgi:hypothetical protein
MGNGWMEIPLLGVDAITVLLLESGTKMYRKGNIKVLFSPLENHPDGIWKHASISLKHRYPTWDEILDVRYTFFAETEEVVQVLPPKSEYINIHKNCFHLWCPVGRRITPL